MRKWAAACVAVMMPAVLLAAPQPKPKNVTLRPGALARWNVVIITLDATSAGRIGTYVPPRNSMPFLDSLGRNGVVYERAYTTVGETGPSHATILSGVPPAVHGVAFNGGALEEKTPWLPSLLHDNGYFTAASTIAFFLDKSRGFGRGFDHFIGIANDAHGRPGAMTTNAVAVDQAMPLLDDLKSRGNKPFFCWIHLKGGHGPLAPIAPKYLRAYDAKLPTAELPPSLAKAMPGWAGNEEMLLADIDQLTRWAHAYYDANLMEADDALQRLMDGFRTRGLTQNTLFIIMADHGESFDHSMLEEHGSSPWESTLRIPLILYSDSPRLAPARVRDRLATTTDIAPTIADLVGIPATAAGFRGASLLRTRRTTFEAASSGALTYDELLRKIVEGKRTADPGQALKNEIADLERTGNFYWASISMRNGKLLKLIHYGRRNSSRNRPSFIKLYDVLADHDENDDLLESGAKMRPTAATMLADARKSDPYFGVVLSDIAAGVLSNDPSAFTRGMSKEAVETLRSLGYLH
jgi:arylsulfatase A-like enzyme